MTWGLSAPARSSTPAPQASVKDKHGARASRRRRVLGSTIVISICYSAH